jgi:hypothetical protein
LQGWRTRKRVAEHRDEEENADARAADAEAFLTEIDLQLTRGRLDAHRRQRRDPLRTTQTGDGPPNRPLTHRQAGRRE